MILAQSSKPNVILIYTNDLGYGHFSYYGATKINTPNIDKLAVNGLRFTNAHCAASFCTLSRYVMMKGESMLVENFKLSVSMLEDEIIIFFK